MHSPERLNRVVALRRARERQATLMLARCRRQRHELQERRTALEREIEQCDAGRRALYANLKGDLTIAGLWSLKLEEQRFEQRKLDLWAEGEELAEAIDQALADETEACRALSERSKARQRFDYFATRERRAQTVRHDQAEDELIEEMIHVH
jgi:hypothetical protein